MLKDILKKLGLSSNTSQIYIWLIEHGPSSARQLSQNIGLPRATIYDNLRILQTLSLVVENEGETKKIYSVSDIKNLEDIFESEIQELEKKQKNLKKIIPGLVIKTQKLEPKIHFYAGANGIKQVLKDLLWYKNIETLTMWPISDMVEILGRDYLEELNRRRIRQRISIRGIWPANKVVDLKNHPYLGIGKEHLRQLRLAPKSMSWDMSYWLYEDKVAFISSNNESFGFIIHSQDFVNLMRTQFEVIWKLSKPIEPQREYTDSFLRTV